MDFINRHRNVLASVFMAYTSLKLVATLYVVGTDEIDERLIKSHKHLAYVVMWPLSLLTKFWLRKKPLASIKQI